MNAGWWFDDDPDDEHGDRLLTADDAAATLGIPRNTIWSWKRRRKLWPAGVDSLGRDVFRVRDIARLRNVKRT